MLSEGLYNVLSTTAALTALLGTARTDGTTGIFNMLAPDEVTIPYVVFSQEGAEPVIAFEGANRLQRAVMRFACYASSAKVVKQVADQVKFALNGLYGTVVAGNVRFEGAWLEREVDLVESIPHGTIYSTHVDYGIWWADQTSSDGAVVVITGDLVAEDFALSGWGNTATISALAGTGQAWKLTVTAGGTGIVINPTVILTFHAGTWANAPIGISKIIGGTGARTDLDDTTTIATWTITYLGLPTAGSTYMLSGITIGR